MGRAWCIAGITAVLWVVHQFVCWRIGLELFRMAGGITDLGGGSYAFGGIDWAWTNLAWLPAGPFLWAGNVFIGVGFLLVMLGSGVAAYATARCMPWLAPARPTGFGRWSWRLWVPLLLWSLWVPVPVRMAWPYWYIVAY
jgi:hypothetical protein